MTKMDNKSSRKPKRMAYKENRNKKSDNKEWDMGNESSSLEKEGNIRQRGREL